MSRQRLARWVSAAQRSAVHAAEAAASLDVPEVIGAPMVSAAQPLLMRAGCVDALLRMLLDRHPAYGAPTAAEGFLAVNARAHLREVSGVVLGLLRVTPDSEPRRRAEEHDRALRIALDELEHTMRRSETLSAILDGAPEWGPDRADAEGLALVAPELIALLVHVDAISPSTARALIGWRQVGRMRDAIGRLTALAGPDLDQRAALRRLGGV